LGRTGECAAMKGRPTRRELLMRGEACQGRLGIAGHRSLTFEKGRPASEGRRLSTLSGDHLALAYT
jgi:hypothetical protein